MAKRPDPTLGVHLLETITKGMYSEPLHSLREYVQNAYDSVRAARRNGSLGPNDGEVSIVLDEESRIIRIRDDGTGLGPEEAAVRLLDLGSSDKAESDSGSARNAGFRGIGRMAGITYCETLRFETSSGDGRKCVVEFDAAGINRLTQAGRKAATIVDAIRQNSEIMEETESEGKRYMEITLNGLNGAGDNFLNEEQIERYLAQSAPVAYAPEWSFGEKIRAIANEAGNPSSLDHVRINIRDASGNRRREIRRPFKNTFSTINAGRVVRRVRVHDVVALPRVGEASDGWWGWLAVHERRGALGGIPFAGLRIRMHNIEIGDASILRGLFTTPNLAMWCFGEIHIVDHQLTPNAQRDNFEDSKGWKLIRERLRAEAVSIDKEIRTESRQRSRSVATLDKRARKFLKGMHDAIEHGFVSRDDQSDWIEKAEAEAKKLADQEKIRSRPEQDRKSIGEIRREVEAAASRAKKVKHTKADKAHAHLSREARRVLRKVHEILKSELDEDSYRGIAEKINTALRPGEEK